ncbi:hypothetical protein NC653_027851 [Populus alba x Populus x berolinensis]|uniref:Uncharacterized protein n=1 Tax=Populus alba x Populus x berolinensis TaxID=444605 RepID=A0AAD6Q7D2_9ROSI|nr:hypothetical protein NC653_027851 [Populus alba x Populus x berolinensis]
MDFIHQNGLLITNDMSAYTGTQKPRVLHLRRKQNPFLSKIPIKCPNNNDILNIAIILEWRTCYRCQKYTINYK